MLAPRDEGNYKLIVLIIQTRGFLVAGIKPTTIFFDIINKFIQM
jgi:hypothetical protein